MYPMGYEEFLWALNKNTAIIQKAYKSKVSLGNDLNRSLMQDFRLYMAVGGMPQAVDEFLKTNNLIKVDKIKNEILTLYDNDLRKIDHTGLLSKMYLNIPSQLALNKKRYIVSKATGKKKNYKDLERLSDLIDSGTVLICYDVRKPSVFLNQTINLNSYKLYIADIGLFTTIIFNNGVDGKNIYKKLINDKLDANLGYMFENVVAQIIASNGKSLYYHTWQKQNSTHYYEIDFLITLGDKLAPIEVKSSSTKEHKSMDEFCKKYSKLVGRKFLLSQKDINHDKMLEFKPFYLLPFILK